MKLDARLDRLGVLPAGRHEQPATVSEVDREVALGRDLEQQRARLTAPRAVTQAGLLDVRRPAAELVAFGRVIELVLRRLGGRLAERDAERLPVRRTWQLAACSAQPTIARAGSCAATCAAARRARPTTCARAS